MASVYVRLCICSASGNRTGDGIAVIDSRPVAKATVTSTGSSQVIDITAPPLAESGVVLWRVEAIGGDVWVKFDETPVAAAGDDWRVVDGEIAYFGARGGDTIAVIDAA